MKKKLWGLVLVKPKQIKVTLPYVQLYYKTFATKKMRAKGTGTTLSLSALMLITMIICNLIYNGRDENL